MVEKDMPLDILKNHIETALKWASEMSEIWTGTLVGDYIDREKDVLKEAVKAEDWEKAYTSMVDLVNLCHDAESKLEEEDING